MVRGGLGSCLVLPVSLTCFCLCRIKHTTTLNPSPNDFRPETKALTLEELDMGKYTQAWHHADIVTKPLTP